MSVETIDNIIIGVYSADVAFVLHDPTETNLITEGGFYTDDAGITDSPTKPGVYKCTGEATFSKWGAFDEPDYTECDIKIINAELVYAFPQTSGEPEKKEAGIIEITESEIRIKYEGV